MSQLPIRKLTLYKQGINTNNFRQMCKSCSMQFIKPSDKDDSYG